MTGRTQSGSQPTRLVVKGTKYIMGLGDQTKASFPAVHQSARAATRRRFLRLARLVRFLGYAGRASSSPRICLADPEADPKPKSRPSGSPSGIVEYADRNLNIQPRFTLP
jgi:hypothetical protein